MAWTPDFLHVFAEASGTAVAQYGTVSGSYAINASSTGYSRVASGGIWSGAGYVAGSGVNTTVLALATAAATPGGGIQTINVAAAFRLVSLNDSQAYIVAPGLSTADGDVRIAAAAAGGGFDLTVLFNHTGGTGTAGITFAGLAFNTDYQLAASLNVSTLTAVVARAKLGSGAVQTSASANYTSFDMSDAWPRLLHRYDFQPPSGAFGFDGRLHYFAYERGGTALSDTDLTDLNSNPTAFITGWPGGGGGSAVAAISSRFLAQMNN